MKKFIVIYHIPPQVAASTPEPTPEALQEGMKLWMAWAEKCGDKLVDMGTPLGGGQSLKPEGASTDSNKGVMGYSILQAEDMDEAKSLMDGHPHLGWNAECEIEIHESMPIPGM